MTPAWRSPSDLSDTVDAEIEFSSDLDGIENNLALWLDAANINGTKNVGLTDNQAIDTWFDMSGKEHHLSQSDATKHPSLDKGAKNNKDVVSFDDDLLTTSTFNGWPNGSISIFVVQRAPVDQSQSTMAVDGVDTGCAVTNLCNREGRFNLHIPWSNESVYWDYGNTTGTGYGRLTTSISANGTSFVRNNYYIYEFSYNDDTTVMTNNKNAVELGQYVSNVTNVADINGKSGYRFNLGHDDYISDAAFEDDIAEILIFSKDLTPAERAKINDYLAAKCGLSAD